MSLLISIVRSVWVGIRMGFLEMWAHKLRSFLSTLGVLLGVASLVTMLTLIGGIDVFINEKIGKWAGSVFFFPKWDATTEERLSWSRSPGMRFDDGGYLHENDSYVVAVKKLIEKRVTGWIAGGNERMSIRATDMDTYNDDMETNEVWLGRGLTAEDFAIGKKVCLIPYHMVERRIVPRLKSMGKDTADIVGMDLTYGGNRFEIVGVFKPEDERARHMRRSVFFPIRAIKTYVTGQNPDPGSIQISIADPQALKDQAELVALTLKSKHRGTEDYQFFVSEWVDKISSMLGNVSILMSIVSAISLVVGGLGIMNVMLSSISERIKEIGVRKALGANSLQIFIQFLAETTTLSCCGGLIGAVLGGIPLFFKEAIKRASQGVIEPTILPLHLIGILLIIMSVGIVFGLYPAIKASRMNPIDALRYE